MRTTGFGLARAFAVIAVCSSLLPALDAAAVSGGYTGRTNLTGGSGCSGCHGTDAGMTVAISGPTALNKGQLGLYTVTATRTVPNGTPMGVNAASSDAGSLSVVGGMPTSLTSNEIHHNIGVGALRTTTSNSATYQFNYTMPGGAAVGSTHTLAAVAVIDYTGAWKHATNFVVTTRPTATTLVTPSGATPTTMNLAWTGGGPEYRVVYKTGAVAPANETDGTQVNVGAVTSTTVTGLTASTQYTFAVFSKLAGGSTVFATTAASASASTTAVVAAARYVNAATGVNTGTCSVVGSPCKTITYAMGQAVAGNPGDTINVAQGTYNVALGEVFPIEVKSGVTLKATGSTWNTIIDGAGDTVQRGLLNFTNAAAATRLEGFRLRNGLSTEAQGGSAYGGAIKVLYSNANTVTITRNWFEANEARGYSADGTLGLTGGLGWGGAIYFFSSTVEITNNVFRANVARGGNAFNNPGVSGSADGGQGHGGAIYAGNNGKIANNTFHGNSAIGGNGANSSGGPGDGGPAQGGAINAMGNPSPDIFNNIFVANASTSGTGGSPGAAIAGSVMSTYSTVDRNLFFGNLSNGGADVGPNTGTNSVMADPLFLGAAAMNFHIDPAGPANSAGTNTGAPTLDYDGLTRRNPPSLGAYEAVYRLVLEGAQETPPITTGATGTGVVFYNPATNLLTYELTYSGLSSAETMAHIHGNAARGASAGAIHTLSTSGSPKTGTATLSAGSETALFAGTLYINIHTSNFVNGEIRAQIDHLGATPVVPNTVAFGGQSMGTTSPAQVVTFTNMGTSAMSVSNVSIPNAQFTQTNNCTSVAVGASCTFNVLFSPAIGGGALNSTVAASTTMTITSNAPGSPHTVALSGTAEKSLVTHYYRAILNRAPDGPGKAFWESEAARLAGLGVNVNETWFVMAGYFFNSAEYVSYNKNDTQFITDLYNTFFNRGPDGGGLSYWAGQISGGLPREVVLFSFMFSTEFVTFTQGIFGNTASRPEVDMVVDFFRGLLNRLPDTTSFNYWLGQLRTAQCQGAGPVYTKVDEISAAFMFNPEYTNRARTNTQFVTDMYYSFLRRGGDIGGVQYWINELNTGARYPNDVRYFGFLNSAEFGARVQAVIAAGCLPGG